MSRIHLSALASVAALCALTTVSCGAGPDSGRPVTVTVLAASSLSDVLPRMVAGFEKQHPDARLSFSFAGSDQLAAQIGQGVRADVFAAADVEIADSLYRRQLVGRPRPFCSNRPVLIVPISDPAGIDSVKDIARPGIKVVLGTRTVPIGIYAGQVLDALDETYGRYFSGAVYSNVVSSEPSSTSILAKIATGEADAGIVYLTDALSAGETVRMIEFPADLVPVAEYAASVVTAGRQPDLGRAFISYLESERAGRILRSAGFAEAPSL